uniref:Secreted protein n=1 Tax=Panstrongylus lignarius TaxID=156445 RepID=A0A224XQB0_9HEMI
MVFLIILFIGCPLTPVSCNSVLISPNNFLYLHISFSLSCILVMYCWNGFSYFRLGRCRSFKPWKNLTSNSCIHKNQPCLKFVLFTLIIRFIFSLLNFIFLRCFGISS